MIKHPSRAVIGRKSLTRLCRVQFRRRQSKKIKPTQGRFNFLVRAKGMYNSLPKSIQSLELLVISAGPFHCALTRCVPNPAPLARLCRVQFRRRQSKKQNRRKVGLIFWCGRRESNPRLQLGKLTCCHYTTPAMFVILYTTKPKVQY